MYYSSFNKFHEVAIEENNEPKVKPAEIDGDLTKSSSAEGNSEAKPDSTKDRQESMGIIEKIIRTIIDLISKMFQRYGGIIDALNSSSDGSFIKNYTEKKKNYKPNVPIKVPTYRCDDAPAERALNNMRSFVREATNLLNSTAYGAKHDDNSILEVEDEEFVKRVLKKLNAPERCKTFQEYLNYLKEVCKGQKAYIVINESDLAGYEKVALLRGDALKMKIRTDLANANEITTKVRNNLKLVSSSKSDNLSKETRKRAEKYSRRMHKIATYYNDFLNTYMHIKINKINVARAILNTVYGIKL